MASYLEIEARPETQSMIRSVQQLIDTCSEALRRGPPRETAEILAQVIQEAARVLAASGDEALLRERHRGLEALLASETEALSVLSIEAVPSPPPPGVPEVPFNLGLDGQFGDGVALASGTLTTNLVGVAIGAGFGAIGSEPLRKYFHDHTAVGVALPFDAGSKPTGQISIGLGGFRIDRFTITPALNIEQVEARDDRLPGDLIGIRPDENRWSSIAFAMTIISREWFKSQLEKGRPALFTTIGVQFPIYYPGDPFQTVGALFSSSRSDFERAGGWRFLVNVSLPLVPLQ